MQISKEQLQQIIKEEIEAVIDEKKKSGGKKDACYHKVRARYDVWPSAYASGALVKCRKVGAANWGNKSKKDEGLALDEEVTPEEEKDLKKASKELSKASEMHKNQSDRIKKALDEKKKNGLTNINEVSTVTIRRGSHKRHIVLEEKNPRIPRKKGQPAKSKKHSDLYTDEDPKGTIHGLGFKDESTARSSVTKIKKSGRSHAHKVQAAVAMEQRAKAAGKDSAAAVYRKYINSVKKSEQLNERCQKGYKTHDTQKTKEMFGKTYRNCVKAEEGLEIEEEKKKAGTESSKESSLRDWFGRKGAKGKKKGWVDCNAPDGKGGYKSCGRSDGEKRSKYPSCRPTPGACKEKGKGKSWGKKAAKGKK